MIDRPTFVLQFVENLGMEIDQYFQRKSLISEAKKKAKYSDRFICVSRLIGYVFPWVLTIFAIPGLAV
jgi:hypothetical protein